MLLLVETKHICEIAQRSDLKTKRDLFKAELGLSAALRWKFKEEVKVDHVVPRPPIRLVAHTFLVEVRNFHPRGFQAAQTAAAGRSAPLFTSAQLVSAQAQQQACWCNKAKGCGLRMRRSQLNPQFRRCKVGACAKIQSEDLKRKTNICFAIQAKEWFLICGNLPMSMPM